MDIPTLGPIVYFFDGVAWRAMWPDVQEPLSSPVGSGATPGEAVAELVMIPR